MKLKLDYVLPIVREYREKWERWWNHYLFYNCVWKNEKTQRKKLKYFIKDEEDLSSQKSIRIKSTTTINEHLRRSIKQRN